MSSAAPSASALGAVRFEPRGYGLSMWIAMALATLGCANAAGTDHQTVHGITVSCPTWGWEWGSDAMASTLDVIASDGANWVAIHPYARIRPDGTVEFEPIDPEAPPAWLARPIAEAHARGVAILIKPHLAYWGSGWSWRGAITLEEPGTADRFFASYRAWIVDLARASSTADAFAVGTELDGTIAHEAEWRRIIAEVRAVHPGHLTYASNWDRYPAVPFWDALDVVGVQAYFPIAEAGSWPEGEVPPVALLDAGWTRVLAEVQAVHERTGKPVVFTELGYNRSARAPTTPWEAEGGGARADEVQAAALEASLRALDRAPFVVGAFLWKWFPGEVQRGNFRLSRPELREVVRGAWGQAEPRVRPTP
ncbi:MAG: hypothetical protein ACI8PZ_005972 [Myxococcota bacterium]|jgi:hypothetical protein